MKKIDCKATQTPAIKNPQKVPSKTPMAPFSTLVTEKTCGKISFSIKVYIDSANTTAPTLNVDSSGINFYVLYDHTEEIPDKVIPWTITAEYSCSLKRGNKITIYNRNTDPITSRGTTTTVKPSMV